MSRRQPSTGSPSIRNNGLTWLKSTWLVSPDTRIFRSVLVELALILLVVTLVINSVARYLLSRFTRRKPLFPSWLWPGPATEPAEPPAAPALFGPPLPRLLLVPQHGWFSAHAVDKVMTAVLF